MLKPRPTLNRPRRSFQVVVTDPTQQILHELKDTSPWLYESLRARGFALDEDLPTIDY
jgi:hypothetical protein